MSVKEAIEELHELQEQYGPDAAVRCWVEYGDGYWHTYCVEGFECEEGETA